MEKVFPTAMQRVGPLEFVPALLTELGADVGKVFEGLELAPKDLVRENRVPFQAVRKLLDACARMTACSHFGLLLGSKFDHRILGLVGDLMETAPTLKEALSNYVGVQRGLSHGLCAYLNGFGDYSAFGIGIYDRHDPGSEQVYGLSMAVAANSIRRLCKGEAQLLEVRFCHRAPKDPSIYERILQAPVRFGQDQTCIFLNQADLLKRNTTFDAERRRQLLAKIQFLQKPEDTTTAARLRHVLRPLLSTGRTSLTEAAERLGIHARTLDRQLASEGTTFAELRDEIRCIMARELLAMTDLPVGDIAVALSYSSHAVFGRAFRRWSGKTPSDWRAASDQELRSSHWNGTATPA
jgi:AraC-like DNA-binding protein